MADSNGFDWMSLLKVLIPAGTSLAGGLLAGDPNQKRTSYKGTAVDPVKMLTDAMANSNGMGQALADKARKGVTVRTTAQNLPGFAADPAIADPSLLKFDGLNLPEGMFKSGPQVSGAGGPGGSTGPIDRATGAGAPKTGTAVDRVGSVGLRQPGAGQSSYDAGMAGKSEQDMGDNPDLPLGLLGADLNGSLATLVKWLTKNRGKTPPPPATPVAPEGGF